MIAYIALGNVDPVGIFLSFGLALCITGAYYRTPFPVQPMKAIGAAAATQADISAGTVYAAGLISGVIWLILGLTGAARKVARDGSALSPACIQLAANRPARARARRRHARLTAIAAHARNAIIAITEENNRIFPQRPVNEKEVTTLHGFHEHRRIRHWRRANVPRRRRHGRTHPLRRDHGRRAVDPGNHPDRVRTRQSARSYHFRPILDS